MYAREKFRSVNFQINNVIAEMSNFVAYIDPYHTWTSGGVLNRNLYYKDNLYEIENGNEKLAKAII